MSPLQDPSNDGSCIESAMSTLQLPTGDLSHAQDAVEYFQHLLKVVDRTERGAAERLGGPSVPPTTAAFTFLASAYSALSTPFHSTGHAVVCSGVFSAATE